MTYDFLKSLYKDILDILSNLVVKRDDLAQAAETVDSIKNFDLYYTCLNGSRYFYNFEKYDIDILEKYMTAHDALICSRDMTKIPVELRDQIVADQAARVIETFEETNNYYRMLNGKPDVDDRNFIYVDDVVNINTMVPIHELNIEQIAQLEVSGKLAELKKAYPNAKYLNYLGINAIDVIDARLARPFEILRTGIPNNILTLEEFKSEYYKARRYTLATIYNRMLFANRQMYEPIVGVIMLTLAIRNTMVPDEAEYLNFEEILNAILESYGLLKYFENFPFTFKRRLVLALDNILKVKGTDGVLVDICRIFSMDNFDAKRYYLMKTQPLDADGHLIHTGDVEKDYELQFVKAAIEDHNISYAQEDITPYGTVVNNDYLWQLTEEEKKAIMSENFNLMMTKYIDIEAAYDLSALTFECCYFLNLLLHSRKNAMKIMCANQYSLTGGSNVYTMIVFLLTALAKRSNFDGNIVYDAEDICEVLRFNNADVIEKIQEITNKYEKQIDVDDTLLEDYDSPIALNLPVGELQINDNEVLMMYIYNRELYNAIVAEMNRTNDIRKYEALARARDCLYTSFMEEDDFRKSDGTRAVTYSDMLHDIDPYLAQKIDSIDMEKDANDLDKMIIYILEKLEYLFSSPELKYLFLNTPSAYGALIEKYLRMAINVFKASSVQLDSINVFFNVGDNDPIRVIDKKVLHKKNDYYEPIHVIDEIAFHKTLVIDDTVYAMDKAYVNE